MGTKKAKTDKGATAPKTAEAGRCSVIEDEGKPCTAPAEPGSIYCADHMPLDDAEPADPRKGKKVQAPSPDPFPRRFTRDMRVELSADERQASVDEYFETLDRTKDLEEKAKESAEAYKDRLGSLRVQLRDLGQLIKRRFRMATVDVEERRNDREGTIETVRLDTTEIIDRRAQTGEERQAPLPGVEG